MTLSIDRTHTSTYVCHPSIMSGSGWAVEDSDVVLLSTDVWISQPFVNQLDFPMLYVIVHCANRCQFLKQLFWKTGGRQGLGVEWQRLVKSADTKTLCMPVSLVIANLRDSCRGPTTDLKAFSRDMKYIYVLCTKYRIPTVANFWTAVMENRLALRTRSRMTTTREVRLQDSNTMAVSLVISNPNWNRVAVQQIIAGPFPRHFT